MQDSTLVTISLSLTGIGLCALLALIVMTDTPSYGVDSEVGDLVTISGRVSDIRSIGALTSFTVTYDASIDAVVFENLTIPDCVVVHGKVDEYEGRRQLVATRIHACGNE